MEAGGVGLWRGHRPPLVLAGPKKNGGRGKLFMRGHRPPVGLPGLKTLAFRYQKKWTWGMGFRSVLALFVMKITSSYSYSDSDTPRCIRQKLVRPERGF